MTGEAVAGEIDVGGVLLFEVVVVGAEQLNGRPGPQIAAADTDDHQVLTPGLDALGRCLDARILVLVVVPGQVHPADEVIALAGGVLEPPVGLGEALDKRLRLYAGVGQINVEHGRFLLSR